MPTKNQIPLPEMRKTPSMRLIEALDPKGRDVREFVHESYLRTKSTEAVAREIEDLTGDRMSGAQVNAWITQPEYFGWSLERTIAIPDYDAEAVPA